jgi:molybdate transport system ATP-binding protein
MKILLRDLRLEQGAFRLQLDLEIEGQVLGIFGKSGAGKTTLLEIIAGLRTPRSGLVQLDDLVLIDSATRRFVPPHLRQIGYVPQDLALFPHLTVRRNCEYGRRRHGSPLGFDHVVQALEIDSLLDRSVGQLSGGQQQRVAFARALLAGPSLLLLDEPLSSLDEELKVKIIPYLQRMRDEFDLPMIYVSHSPDEMVALCDRVILLREGSCAGSYAPREIFELGQAMKLRDGLDL